MANTGGMIMTTTGAYNIDYDAAYAARKQNRQDGYNAHLESYPSQRAESIGKSGVDMHGSYNYSQQQQ